MKDLTMDLNAWNEANPEKRFNSGEIKSNLTDRVMFNDVTGITDILNDAALKDMFRGNVWHSILSHRVADNNSTLLMWAIDKGHIDLALSVARQSPQEHFALRDEQGWTALSLAVICKRIDVALELVALMRPEDLSLKSDGKTALFLAIERNKIDVAKAIIERTPPEDLALRDNDGDTPLIDCYKGKKSDIGLLLIARMRPEDLQLRNNVGKTAIDYVGTHELDNAFNAKKYSQAASSAANKASAAELPDTQSLIDAVVASGSTAQALDIGEKLSDACSRYFENVAQWSVTSAVRGAESAHNLGKLLSRVDASMEFMKTLKADPAQLVVPAGFEGAVVRTLRALRLQKDPQKLLQSQAEDIGSAVESSLTASMRLASAIEDFQAHYPEIKSGVDTLVAELDAGFAKIEAAEKAEDKPMDERTARRLKSIFQDTKDVATVTLANVMMAKESADDQLDAEADFAGSVKKLRAAAGSKQIFLSQLMAQAKGALTDELSGVIGGILVEQFEQNVALHRTIQHRKAVLLEDRSAVTVAQPAAERNLSPVS